MTKIDNLKSYRKLNPLFETLIDYLKENDLNQIREGVIEIKNTQLYGNCFSYYADGIEGEFFEAHKKYLDIHVVVNNTEKMAISTISSCTITKEYEKKNDIEFYKGTVEQIIQLKEGDCLITFPEDLHQPKIKINDKLVKKVVFKVLID